MNLEYLDPPQLVVLSETEGQDERRVSNWITEWDFEEEIDVGIIGVPMDTSTMVDSVLTETPNNIRRGVRPLHHVQSRLRRGRAGPEGTVRRRRVDPPDVRGREHPADGGHAPAAVRVQLVVHPGRGGRRGRGDVAGGHGVRQGHGKEAGHRPLRLPQRHAQPRRGRPDRLHSDEGDPGVGGRHRGQERRAGGTARLREHAGRATVRRR